ncbi:hypothetical protein D3C76_1476170 [compost metagenome]
MILGIHGKTNKLRSTSTNPPTINFLKPKAPRALSATIVITKDPIYRAAEFNPFIISETPIWSNKIANSGRSKPCVIPVTTITAMSMR